MRQFPRNLLIAAGVVLFHLAALWALQSGLVRHAAEVIVPVAILSERVEPPVPANAPVPAPEPPRAQHKPPPERVRKPAAKIERPLRPEPSVNEPVRAPLVDSPPDVAPSRPLATPADDPVASRPIPAPEGPAMPPRVELPSSNASYLQNPMPVYPPISKRLGEQGKVVVRVLIGPDGAPRQAELKHSSGFERLDRSALAYVMKCRYVPGKVEGVPRAMWYEAPVSFVLE